MNSVHRIVSIALLTFVLTMTIRSNESSISPQIARLRKELAALDETESTTSQRRICKRVIRRAESLRQNAVDKADQYRALSVIFECRQILVTIEGNERNREALIQDCKALAGAPDSLAGLRLPADLLLVQIRLDAQDLSKEKAREAITGLTARYKRTPAEADCLMAATVLAREAGNAELHKEFHEALKEHGHVPKVKAFLREHFGRADRDFVFRGKFSRADGSAVVLPVDRLGHAYLVCFWSQDLDKLEKRLQTIKAVQMKFPGRFEVYSFNLDELPDHGQRILRRMKLNWVAMKCPKGVRNDAYLAFARTNEMPYGLLAVNERGYVRGRSYNWVQRNRGLPTEEDEARKSISSHPSRWAHSIMPSATIPADPGSCVIESSKASATTLFLFVIYVPR